jgi:fused signal recognition particle receptor
MKTWKLRCSLADTGVKATEQLLVDLKFRVKDSGTTDPRAVKGLLIDALTHMLTPLEKPLVIGKYSPTVIMVAGVNGAGKTTSIGKLTRHLADSGASVLLAAADTFRAAAREQLGCLGRTATPSTSSARTVVIRPPWRLMR